MLSKIDYLLMSRGGSGHLHSSGLHTRLLLSYDKEKYVLHLNVCLKSGKEKSDHINLLLFRNYMDYYVIQLPEHI